MCFLSEVINGDCERSSDNISLFTESIIVATICGRTLEHKQRTRVVDQYEFCCQHQSLNALLIQRIKMLSMHVSSMSEHPDPMLIFVALMAYMVVFMLCETIESRPLGTEAQVTQVIEALLMEHKQRSLDAVHELGMLTSTLRQLNHFQVSLFPSHGTYHRK